MIAFNVLWRVLLVFEWSLLQSVKVLQSVIFCLFFRTWWHHNGILFHLWNLRISSTCLRHTKLQVFVLKWFTLMYGVSVAYIVLKTWLFYVFGVYTVTKASIFDASMCVMTAWTGPCINELLLNNFINTILEEKHCISMFLCQYKCMAREHVFKCWH